MSYTYTSTLECLLRVKISGGIAEVFLGKSGIEYNIQDKWDWEKEGGKEDKRKFLPDHRLASVEKVDQFLLNTLSEGERALIGYEKGVLYSFNSVHDPVIVYFGKLKQHERKKKGLPTLELEDGTVCSKAEDYCKAFGIEPTYTNKGRVMRWANSQQVPLKKLESPQGLVYEPEKVVNLEPTKNSFGKPSVVLNYKGYVPIRGFTNIVAAFPQITLTQVASLYKSFGLSLPQSAKRFFRDKKKGPNKFELISLIKKYGMTKSHRYKGELSLWSFSEEAGQVLANVQELADSLKNEGENLKAKEVQEIWDLVMC